MSNVALIAELDRLHHRATDLRAREAQLADAGENDPASDTWKTAAIVAASAECEFHAALVAAWPTISRVLREAAEGWRPILVTPEIVRYIAQYGGRCRDCADTIMRPVCEGTGMPCGGADGAVRHVLSALNYGFAHGFLKPPPPPSTEPATHSLEPRNDD